MKKIQIIMALLLMCGMVRANDVYRWNFTNDVNYDYNHQLIDVDTNGAGQAQLILQSDTIFHTLPGDYTASNTVRQNVSYGAPVNLSLSQYTNDDSDLVYYPGATFTSRPFYSPLGFNYMQYKAANYDFLPSSADPALKVLVRMDGNWINSVEGKSWAITGDPHFTPDAKSGGSAGDFNGDDSVDVNAPLQIHGASAITIACWVKLRRYTSWGGILIHSIRVGDTIGLSQRPESEKAIGFALHRSGNYYNAIVPIDLNKWYFVTATWDNNGDKKGKLYLNGALMAESAPTTAMSFVAQQHSFKLAFFESVDAFSDAIIDEAAIWARALSADEVAEIYHGYRDTYPLRFQVRSAGTIAGLTNSAFSGPQGTNSTYFKPLQKLESVPGSFNVDDPYAQYKVTVYSSTNQMETPYLMAAGLFNEGVAAEDQFYGDFVAGTISSNLELSAGSGDQSFLGLNRTQDGGYFTNGVYISKIIDAGQSVYWSFLGWDYQAQEINPLSSPVPGLIGLYHCNNLWSDDSGQGNHPSTSSGFTSLAKVGRASAYFSGADSVEIPSLSGVQSVEFWINDDNPNETIMDFSTNKAVVIKNGYITTEGFADNIPDIYVNEIPNKPQLYPGWNHVAVIWPSPITTVGVTIGNGMHGYMDEVAVFDRKLNPAEIRKHYFMGAPNVAGKVKFQGRASDDPTFEGVDFVGGTEGDPNSYLLSPANTKAGEGRYFQYRAVFEGAGDATPGIKQVTILYPGTALVYNAVGDFEDGEFVDNKTAWWGERIPLRNNVDLGPANIKYDTYLMPMYGLWHLDESLWGVTREEVKGVYVTPDAGASPSSESRIGPGCGFFDGISGKILLQAELFDTREMSVAMWIKSTSTNRAPLMSSYQNDLNTYFTLEFNSDGTQQSIGRAAFTLKNGDGSVIIKVATWQNFLNDGKWHHIVGMRNRGEVSIYVDGALGGVEQNDAAKFADISGNNPVLAYGGKMDSYYGGFIDEVAIFSWPLSRAEIGDIAGGGAITRDKGVFEGPIAQAADSTIWEDLQWMQTGRYGIPVLDDAADLVALWHLDDTNASGNVIDSSGNGNDGVVQNGALLGAVGRFGNAVQLDGINDTILFSGTTGFDSPEFTASVWIKLDRDKINNAMALDASDGSGGYQIGTDANGYPMFWLGTVSGSEVLKGLSAVRSGVWTHLAASYDGASMKFFVNGSIVGEKAVNNAQAYSGDVTIGTLAGYVDDVAVFSKALSYMQINDIYRSGIASVKVQARSWDPDPQSGYVGPGGTNSTYFMDAYNTTLRGAVPFGRYMQYKMILSTEDGRYAPDLYGISAKFSAYPLSGPPVAPVAAAAFDFVGNLVALRDDTTLEGPGSEVHYQVSGDRGDNPRWFYFDTSDSNNVHWAQVDPLGLPQFRFQSNLRGEISSKLTQLRQEYYPKSNGLFRFRALLGSGGEFNTHINWVELEASSGRIVVTAPNGDEVGNKAWIAGAPYDITWEYAGDVSGTVRLDYSTDGGNYWVNITNGIPADAGHYTWVTPSVSETKNKCLVRIRHEQDSTIYDQSDNMFEIVWRYNIDIPNGGEKWYIGETNTIVFDSPHDLGSVTLDFSDNDDWAHAVRIVKDYVVPTGTRSNTYVWVTPTDEPGLVSEKAKIRASASGYYNDESDDFFIMAGASFTAPIAGSRVNRGTRFNVQWDASACGTNVTLEFQSAPTAPWSVIASNIVNVSGANSFSWNVTNAPTETARLRVVSEDDPRARGISEPFTIAALVLKQPNGNPDPARAEKWLNGNTYKIKWVSAGVDRFVNIKYSYTGTNGPWLTVRDGYPNSNTEGFTNEFDWVVPPTPSGHVIVKVEDASRPTELFDTSDNEFHIAGVALTWPNGGEEWVLNTESNITWVQDAVGANAKLEFSYDGGNTYTSVNNNAILAVGFNPFTPILPTVKGMTRITPNNPAPFSNIVDMADAEFTVAGILIERPTVGDRLGVGNRFPVTFVAAGTHAPGFQADVYYSSDNGVTWDTDKVKENYVFSEDFPGRNSFNWLVEATREPTKEGRLKIVAGNIVVTSELFSVKGVRFNSPAENEIVPVGNTTIKWSTAGFPSDAKAAIYLSYNAADTNSYTNLLGTGFLVGSLELPWTLPKSIEPTTNAGLKMVIVDSSEAEDIGYSTYSKSFKIQNIKVYEPTAGATLVMGQPFTVRWKAAEAGSSVDILYSSDGGSNYDAVAVGQAIAQSDGYNTYTWNVEMDRLPSTHGKIKIVSNSGLEAESAIFSLNGIKVLRPRSTDIYVAAAGAVNNITWKSVGDNGPYTLAYSVNGGSWTDFATAGAGTSLYNWDGASIPPAAVSSNVQIRITGASYTNVSPLFLIVDKATILVSAPKSGAFWHIGDTYRVKWSKGGDMPNDFSVYISMTPYTSTQQITGISIAYDANDNSFWFDWTVPDNPTQAKFFIKHNDAGFPDVWAYSGEFNMIGSFVMLSPNGGEMLFAARPTPIVWRTRGKIPFVDVYYSATAPYAAGSWIKLNDQPIANAYDDDETDGRLNWVQSSWAPPMPDFRSDPNVKFRVQEHRYSQHFDEGIDGPFDDSDRAFWIRYYHIYWQVFDESTGLPLDKLAVVDSSGWSASDLSSVPPAEISNDYPWGKWNTEWYRNKFYDKPILNWSSEINGNPAIWTQTVYMAHSEKEPSINVMANFTYKTAGTNFVISTWMERGGIVIENPSTARIYIYNDAGNLLSNMPLTVNAPQENGVFWDTWSARDLDKNKVYFARVEIDYSGDTYSSGLTFELRVSAGEEIIQELNKSLAGVQSNLTSEISDVGGALSDFRNAAMQSLTNIEDKIDVVSTNVNALTNAVIGNAGMLSNQVSVIGALTNLAEKVDNMSSDTVSSLAHILTRPETMVYGSTNSIVYKTRGNYASGTVQLKVYRSNGSVVQTLVMSEIAAGMGLYETTVRPTWGYGNFSIECKDPQASDRIVVRVVQYDLQAMPGMIDGIATNMAGLVARMDNVDHSVSNMYDVIGSLTNLQLVASNVVGMAAAFEELSSNVFDLIDVTDNLETNIDTLVNRIGTLDLSQLSTNVSALSGNVSNMVAQLGNVDLMAMSSNVDEVLNIVGSLSDLSSLTNAFAKFQSDIGTNLVGLTSNMTKVADSLQGVDFNSMYGYVTNIFDAVSGGVTGGYATVSGNISNLIDKINQLSGDINPMITNVSDIAAQFSGLSMQDMYSAVTNVETLVGGIGDIAQVGADISNAVDELKGMTNLTDVSDSVNQLLNQLQGIDLSTLGGDVSNISDNVQQAMTMLGDVNAIVTSVSNSVDSLNGVDMTAMSDNITNIMSRLDVLDVPSLKDDLTNLVDIVGGLGDLATLQSNVSNIVDTLKGITNLADVSTNVLQMKAKLDSFGEWPTNFAAVIDGLRGIDFSAMSIDLTNVLGLVQNIDMASLRVPLTNILARIDGLDATALMQDVTTITNQLAIADLLTMGNNITNILTQVGALDAGAISGSVTELTNALNGIDFAGMGSNITNILSTVQGIDTTKISSDVGQITNLLATVDLIRRGEDITNILAKVNALDADKLSTAVTSLTNAMDGINFTRMDSNITNILEQVGALDAGAISGSVTELTNALNGIDFAGMGSGITNIEAMVSALDAGAMSAAVNNLTNALKGIDFAGMGSGITNIEAMVRALDAGAMSDAVNNLTNALKGIDFAAMGGNITSILDRVSGLDGIDFAAMNTNVVNLISSLGNVSLTTMQSNIVTVLNAVGGITNIDQLANSLQGVDLGQMSSDLSNVLVSVQGMGDVGSLSSNVIVLADKMDVIDGLADVDFSVLPKLDQSIGTAAVGDILENIERVLGTTGDTPNANTFFGKLANVDSALNRMEGDVLSTKSTVGQISRDSAKAAQNSQSARTKADAASSAAKKVMEALEAGDLSGTKKELARMRSELAAAQQSIDQIPKGGVVRDVYSQVQQMSQEMRKFAESKGFTWLTTMQEIPGTGGKGAEAGADKGAINALNANMQDMKGSMDFMKKLLDEMRYEPVVQDSLIGVE